MADAEAAGWPVVHQRHGGGIAKFAYLDTGGFTSTVIEVMELNDTTRWMTTMVRDAARGLGRPRRRADPGLKFCPGAGVAFEPRLRC